MFQKLRENLHDIMDPAAAYERAQAVQPMLDTYTDRLVQDCFPRCREQGRPTHACQLN